jgi:hypothetical protein
LFNGAPQVKAKSVDMAQQLAVKRLNQQYARGIRLTALAIIATFGTNSQQPATASRSYLRSSRQTSGSILLPAIIQSTPL